MVVTFGLKEYGRNNEVVVRRGSTVTVLIKAVIFHWGRGSSSGDKQLKIQNALAPPPSFHVTIDFTLVG